MGDRGTEPKVGKGDEPKGGTEDDGRQLDKERANSIFL